MDNDLEEFESWHQDLACWEKMQDSHGRLLGADSMQDLSDEWEDGVISQEIQGLIDWYKCD